MSIKFACDSVPNCEGQIVNRVGSVLVIEGTGFDAGSYFAKAGLAHRFSSRKQAEDCAKTLGGDAVPPSMEQIRGREANAGKIIDQYDQGQISRGQMITELKKLGWSTDRIQAMVD